MGPVKRPRIVLSKLGLAGDDRGAKVIARLLRDTGVEVVYTGPQADLEGVIEAAIEEDADALALCILSGDHMTLAARLLELLRACGAGEVRVLVTGTVPAEDAAELERLGVTAVLRSGTAVEQVGTFLRCEVSRTELCR